jgi:glucose-1-phosphate adenylyltransferase
MNALGIIFTDSFDTNMEEYTERRTLASLPYGGRYRLVDFPLSNMANAGVKNIGIITRMNYQSLAQHLRSGADWDLSRKFNGITILPPYSTQWAQAEFYENRLEGLIANLPFLRFAEEKYVVITGCHQIWNEDIKDMVDKHAESGAKITVVYSDKVLNHQEEIDATYVKIDEEGAIVGQRVEKVKPRGYTYSLNTYIIERELLISLIETAQRDGKKSFRRDVIRNLIERGEAMGYEAKGVVLAIENPTSYLESSLALLEPDVRKALFANDDNPIITPARDSAPTKYGEEAVVENSFIADGVIIEGEVRNSVIFRGATIEKGAVVENSVVMQDTIVSENARINYCVLDKDVLIEKGRWLSGYITHPFYVKRSSRI